MIKTVIFDMDNTLIDRQRAFTEMLHRVLTDILPNRTLAEIDQMVSDIIKWDNNGQVERIVTFQKWIDQYEIKEISASEFSDKWSRESGSVTYLFDDVVPTLKALKARGYQIGVLSNGNASSQRRKLKTIDIYEYLDYSLISGEYGKSKPDPEIFQYTANQMHSSVEECLYVGDNYTVDIVGSRSAGMQSLYVDRTGKVYPNVDTIHNIYEILSYLDKNEQR